MDKSSSLYNVHLCSKCPGNTEYHCVSCSFDLCLQCKENHIKSLKTIDHDVVSYRDKINYIPTQEICVRHPSNSNINFCELCQIPVCNDCQTHRKHKKMDVITAYKTKQQQQKGTIHTIRSDVLFYRTVLLTRIKPDVKICQTEFSCHQLQVLTKAQRLKNLIDYVIYDLLNNVFCDFDFKHRCLKQKIITKRHIFSLERYIHRYEQTAFVFSALQFLSSIKKTHPQIHLTIHTSKLSVNESLNNEDVPESLSAIQITERGYRRVENDCFLKWKYAKLHQSLTLRSVGRCYHISCVTTDLAWVSYRNNIILTNTAGDLLHRVEDLCSGYIFGNGSHTTNSESELIYINSNYKINKLSKDMKTTTTFIESTDSRWRPLCVYWSPSTGDLLVGMYNSETETGKVTRYSQGGQLTQTIQHDDTGGRLYKLIRYITENNNEDIVVSHCDTESGAVMATERGGKHRFTYTGFRLESYLEPNEPQLEPNGICTDALSHILVCDWKTKSVLMLDKNGEFLTYLLTKSEEMGKPRSLSYDVNTHRLWVGSEDNNKVFVYRYITRQDSLTESEQVTKKKISIDAFQTIYKRDVENDEETDDGEDLYNAYDYEDIENYYHEDDTEDSDSYRKEDSDDDNDENENSDNNSISYNDDDDDDDDVDDDKWP